jgi:hypothetical protein
MEEELRDLATNYVWTISPFEPSTDTIVLVDLANRHLTVSRGKNLGDLGSVILAIITGTYSSSEYGKAFLKCMNGSVPKVKVRYQTKDLTGPQYWSNSCNIDSVLAIIAY